jgi:hypothetical protein
MDAAADIDATDAVAAAVLWPGICSAHEIPALRRMRGM